MAINPVGKTDPFCIARFGAEALFLHIDGYVYRHYFDGK